ncbi:hypothetical protein M8J76_006014, partial [Diaphorina citri]
MIGSTSKRYRYPYRRFYGNRPRRLYDPSWENF